MATVKTRAASRSKKKMIADEGARGGFTIIEVVLVLAIAGLIFLMVFIALPALQRSQRDTQRRNDLARVTDAITNYQTNNNGRLPANGSVDAVEETDEGVPMTGANGYGCDTGNAVGGNAGGAKRLVCDYLNGVNAEYSEWVDPDGFGYGLTIADFDPSTYGDPRSFIDYDEHIVYVLKGANCNGEEAIASNNTRDYVVMYRLEGAGVYCQD